jgi:hypothetical protein
MVELCVKKINIGQSASSEDPTPVPQNTQMDSYESAESYSGGNSGMMYRITPQKITELLELRNKARR